MRVLCICNAGEVRSAGLASRLKALNYEAIAIGAHISSIETLRYMIDWADRIVDLSDDGRVVNMLREEERKKYMRCYIGKDVWGNPRNEDLQAKLSPITAKILEETFGI